MGSPPKYIYHLLHPSQKPWAPAGLDYIQRFSHVNHKSSPVSFPRDFAEQKKCEKRAFLFHRFLHLFKCSTLNMIKNLYHSLESGRTMVLFLSENHCHGTKT